MSLALPIHAPKVVKCNGKKRREDHVQMYGPLFSFLLYLAALMLFNEFLDHVANFVPHVMLII